MSIRNKHHLIPLAWKWNEAGWEWNEMWKNRAQHLTYSSFRLPVLWSHSAAVHTSKRRRRVLRKCILYLEEIMINLVRFTLGTRSGACVFSILISKEFLVGGGVRWILFASSHTFFSLLYSQWRRWRRDSRRKNGKRWKLERRILVDSCASLDTTELHIIIIFIFYLTFSLSSTARCCCARAASHILFIDMTTVECF